MTDPKKTPTDPSTQSDKRKTPETSFKPGESAPAPAPKPAASAQARRRKRKTPGLSLARRKTPETALGKRKTPETAFGKRRVLVLVQSTPANAPMVQPLIAPPVAPAAPVPAVRKVKVPGELKLLLAFQRSGRRTTVHVM